LTGFTLDTGALIALERGERRVIALLNRAVAMPDAVLHVPAAVLAQAFRGGPRQARLARLLGHRQTRVVPLDSAIAQIAGVLLGARGGDDVVDASVVVCARRYRQPVVTGDPQDLRRLDPKLLLEVI
jgi:predicted nucleic acid-binding protein